MSYKLIEVISVEELSRIMPVAREMDDISIRIIDDASKARVALFYQKLRSLRSKYPTETNAKLRKAAWDAWPVERVNEYFTETATHRVIELTFTGSHNREELRAMASHGFSHGHHIID